MTAICNLVDFHEPSAEMLAALGRDERRNIVIASHYLASKEKFGETLVFATDVVGAAKLADAFRSKGVDAEYVASWRRRRLCRLVISGNRKEAR